MEKAESSVIFALPRQQALGYWHVIYGLALSACWLNGLPTVMRCLLITLVVVLWLQQSRSKTGSRAQYLSYTRGSKWAVSDDGADFFPVRIETGSMVTRHIIVLRYSRETDGKLHYKTLFIARSQMSAQDYRRLAVKLKLSRNDRNR